MQTLERDRLITEYLDYTGALAAEMMSQFNLHGVVGYDDVLGFATLGLTTAASRYQPDRGVHFKTFSYPAIRGAVIDGLRVSHRARQHHQHWKSNTGELTNRTAPLPRSEKNAHSNRWLHVEHLDGAQNATFDPFSAVDDALDLRRALDTLPELERQIIVLYYFEDLTDLRIGKRLGWSQTFIARKRQPALQALAAALGNRSQPEAWQ